MKKTGPAARATASAKKDKAKRAIADDTASDSASSEDGRLVKKRERDKKLKRDLQEQEEETQRIQRLIDEATLKNKEKLKELAAVRNSYPVIVRIFFLVSVVLSTDIIPCHSVSRIQSMSCLACAAFRYFSESF